MIGRKFTFESFETIPGSNEVLFHYTLETDEKTFELTERLTFPLPINTSETSNKVLRALHIALGISYYKTFLPPEIVHSYKMSGLESSFWNTVYKNGLGEFLYKNQIDSSKLAKFQTQDTVENQISTEEQISWNQNLLIGLGGGKDSIVAGELLREAGFDLTAFVLATGETLGQTQDVANTMGVELLAVKREIDPQILEINKLDGALNGHIPISLIFGLVGALLAVLRGNKYVVVANEASASIPQTVWKDEQVNHQWSKSFEFERLFQDYLHAYVSPEIDYFSAIRPFSSVAIAKKFSQYPKYFEVFTSDNSLFKINASERVHPRWSPESSKTLSSFILLAPWMSDEDLTRAFGRNYLEEENLETMCGSLLGENGQSVLDCVGTPDELKSSLAELVNQGRFLNSKLINYSKHKNLLDNAKPLGEFLGRDVHSIPEEIANKIIEKMG